MPTIKYLAKDFSQLKQELLDLGKVYYPNTHKDFTPASVGAMFIDMVAATGDVLSFYTDYQFNEAIASKSTTRKSLIDHANSRGYVTKPASPAYVAITLSHLIPATKNDSGETVPDYSFAQVIKPGMSVVSNTGVTFIVQETVDFSSNTTTDARSVSVYSRNNVGNPDFYTISKTATAISANIGTMSYAVADAVDFLTVPLSEKNVIGILSVVDSDGYVWRETDFLANSLVQVDEYSSSPNAPVILQYEPSERRFIVRVSHDDTTYLKFGAGTSTTVFSADMIVSQSALIATQRAIDGILNRESLLHSNVYGQAPKNTTLTIKYMYGGGESSNVPANTISSIGKVEYYEELGSLNAGDKAIVNVVRRSMRVNNENAATGGRGHESDDELRENMLASYQSQNRIVTVEDYKVRSLSMPQKYGAISKVDVKRGADGAIELYVLCKDAAGKLVVANDIIKNNLRTYIDRYRVLTDEVRIYDGFIINLGVEFGISCFKSFSKKDVLSECMSVATAYLSTNNMQFNSPLSISRLRTMLGAVSGVYSVNYINVSNLTTYDGEYSENYYDVAGATREDILYPSLDTSIFEVKYPNVDIVGKV